MSKLKMLYASPFAPKKSGISDYSEILVHALSKKFDITLLIDDYKIECESLKNYDVLRYKKDTIDFSSYDYLVYNMGNNPDFHDYMYELCIAHPGLIILHDFVLYYLFVGHYQKLGTLYSKLYEFGGRDALLTVKNAVKVNGNSLLEQKELAARLPLNKELLESGNKIMVHSEYALNAVLEHTDQARRIPMIQQVSSAFTLIDKEKLFKKYGIPKDAYIISSFGIVAPSKLNHVACEVVQRMGKNSDKELCYVMVGEGEYVDSYVDGKRIIKTGYVDMDEFDSFIVHSDMVLNLRHPSMGETSAALVKILQMGKPCVIVDEAWFSEIPDTCAIKLSVNEIERQLEDKLAEYINDDKKCEMLGTNARNYIAKEYSEDYIISEIERFLMEQ